MQELIQKLDKKIGMFPVTELLPLLAVIEKQNGLNINRSREFNIVRRILVKSIILN